MAWPALTKLIMGRAMRLPSGELDLSLGERAASEFLQDSLRGHPLDLESVVLLSVAARGTLTVHEARTLYEDIRGMTSALAAEILNRELAVIQKAQLEFALSDSDIRAMCFSMASVGMLELAEETTANEEQRFTLSVLIRESAAQIIASLSPVLRSSFIALTASFLIARGRLNELLEVLVEFESWEVLNRVVESQWWELLDMPTSSVKGTVARLPEDVSYRSMKLRALSIALRDESESEHTSKPQTVLSALLGRSPERNRLCPEADFLGFTEYEFAELTDAILTWGFSRFLAGGLSFASTAYQAVETALRPGNEASSKAAALSLVAYQAALHVLRGGCHLVESSRAELELLASGVQGPTSEIAVTVLNWQRNSQLESCQCASNPTADVEISMLQGIRTASHNYCAMAGDNYDQSLAQLESALEALPSIGSQVLVKYLLTDAYAYVLMRLGRIPDARTLLDSVSDGALFAEANARLTYLSGQFDEAIKIAEWAQNDLTTVPREAIALNTLVAVSAWELKEPHLAFEALKSAFELAKKNHVWLYFALIPRAPMRETLVRAPEIFREIDAVVAGRYVDFPVPHKLGTLSPKESEVLIVLSAEGSISATPKTLFLAVNTVKTHTRNIYRKMEVQSVAESVAQAREFGLTQ